MDGLENIAEPLLRWFDANARVLPWREEPTPYRVWVSEIMLQQTRVQAVRPYYERFMGELPDVQALADCPEDRLMKLWEGLGYYNRARNLKKAAVILKEEYGGEMPRSYEKILSLPGIGSYTAGAVASIAYGLAVPAVDGNVLRVISRLTMLEDDILKASVKKKVEEAVGALIPVDRPGAFNQALMELGAMVCGPNGPADCERCPLSARCLAHLCGRTAEFPKKAKKKERRVEERTVFVILAGDRAAIRKRPETGLLAGLYELPNVAGYLDRNGALDILKEWGMRPERIRVLKDARHIFSHIEWHMTGYAVWVRGTEAPEEFLFVEPQRAQSTYSIPSAFDAYTKYLQIRRDPAGDTNETEKNDEDFISGHTLL